MYLFLYVCFTKGEFLCAVFGSSHFSGIGAIPDAALAAMHHHKDLGIHTEMFSDGVLDLVECNAITNAKKHLHPGKVRFTFFKKLVLDICRTYFVSRKVSS